MNTKKIYPIAILLLVIAMGGTLYKYWARGLTELVVLSIPYLFVLTMVMVEKSNGQTRYIRSIYTPLIIAFCYAINFKFESIHLYDAAVLVLIAGQLTVISIGELMILLAKRKR
ncbi:hypothetical protein N480_21355 [Pseudoalteromonas luteoviolacea S2607]|uniref:hypothetical protein n=1 Tax=Pseudoalteromonas luteoviolacea TaxID=43657 RepID=UPI0007B08A17|nr:hypothetical protein [Pseudoalteromonas luteoviolacea]KZN34575.1 hypothetical protein N480_21355 [Pseudoalteromonas luteoviolacea S2607]